MERKYMKRTRAGDALVNKDELIAIAQEAKFHLVEFGAEMRAPGPDPRPTEKNGDPLTPP